MPPVRPVRMWNWPLAPARCLSSRDAHLTALTCAVGDWSDADELVKGLGDNEVLSHLTDDYGANHMAKDHRAVLVHQTASQLAVVHHRATFSLPRHSFLYEDWRLLV